MTWAVVVSCMHAYNCGTPIRTMYKFKIKELVNVFFRTKEE
jgi:hypothetical protein